MVSTSSGSARQDGASRDSPAMSGVIRHRGGLLPLLIASIVWGVWNTADKYAVSGLPVVTVMALMLVTATAVLWTVLLVTGRERPRPGQLRRLALTGLFEPAIGYGAIGLGLVHVQATTASLMDGTEACFVVAFVALHRHRRPALRSVAGVALSAAGVAALGGVHVVFGLGPGDLLVLGGVAAAALSSVIASRVLEDLDAIVTTTGQFSFGLLFMIPLLAWQWAARGSLTTPATRPLDWAVATVVCGGGLAVAFLLYNSAIARIPVTAAGVIINVSPLFGVAAAVGFLSERVSRWDVIGAVLILSGIFLFAEHDTEG